MQEMNVTQIIRCNFPKQLVAQSLSTHPSNIFESQLSVKPLMTPNLRVYFDHPFSPLALSKHHITIHARDKNMIVHN